METKTRYVLKHESGQYYSQKAEHTRKLWEAWRFFDEDQAQVWIYNSNYAPKHPEKYKLIAVRMTIEEVENSD